MIGTHNLLSGSFSLIFSNTLISRRAASLYFSTFLIIFRATWAPPLENTKKYKAKSRDHTKPKMFYICYSKLTFGSRCMLNCRYLSDINVTAQSVIWDITPCIKTLSKESASVTFISPCSWKWNCFVSIYVKLSSIIYLQGRGHSIHKGPQSHKGKILQRQFAWGELQHVTKAAK